MLIGAFLAFLIGSVDLGTITTATGVITAMFSIPYVNPPPRNLADKSTPVAPVALYIQIVWPDGYPHDIDTWITCHNIAGGEQTNHLVVNYKQKSDLWVDLLRDDLGGPSIINLEQVQSNSEAPVVPPHAFCRVNAHLYHSHGGVLPVSGTLLVIANKDGEDEQLISSLAFTIRSPGEEITLLRVAWDGHSKVVKNSIAMWPDVETVKIATGG